MDANEGSINKSSLGRNDSGRNEQEEEKSELIDKEPIGEQGVRTSDRDVCGSQRYFDADKGQTTDSLIPLSVPSPSH